MFRAPPAGLPDIDALISVGRRTPTGGATPQGAGPGWRNVPSSPSTREARTPRGGRAPQGYLEPARAGRPTRGGYRGPGGRGEPTFEGPVAPLVMSDNRYKIQTVEGDLKI